MHQDKKHIKTSAIAEYDTIGGIGIDSNFLATSGQQNHGIAQADNKSMNSEYIRTPSIANMATSGWIGGGGSSGYNTMSKRKRISLFLTHQDMSEFSQSVRPSGKQNVHFNAALRLLGYWKFARRVEIILFKWNM